MPCNPSKCVYCQIVYNDSIVHYKQQFYHVKVPSKALPRPYYNKNAVLHDVDYISYSMGVVDTSFLNASQA